MAEEYIPIFNRKRDTLQELADSIGAIDSSVSPEVSSFYNLNPQRVQRGVQDRMDFFEDSQDLVPLMNSVNRNRLAALSVERPEIVQREGLFAREPKNRLLRGLQRLSENYMAKKGYIKSDLDIAQENQSRILEAQKLQELYGSRADDAQQAVDRQRARLARSALGSEFIDETSPEVMAQTLTPEQINEANLSRSGLDMTPLDRQELARGNLADFTYEEQLNLIANKGKSDYGLSEPQISSLLRTNREDMTQAIADTRVNFNAVDSAAMNRPPDIGDMKNPFTGDVELAEIPQLDLQEFRRFGKILTQPERTINESYGAELRQWNLVDSIQTASNIDRLQEVEAALMEAVLTGDTTISGPIISLLPDNLKARFKAGATNLEELVAAVTQQSLRELLGGQFAFQENQQLIQRAYNPRLPPIMNLARIMRTRRVLSEMAQRKTDAYNHLMSYGTLFGTGETEFKGSRDVKDFERDFMNKLFPEGDDKFDEVMSEFTDEQFRAIGNRMRAGKPNEASIKLYTKEYERRKANQEKGIIGA